MIDHDPHNLIDHDRAHHYCLPSYVSFKWAGWFRLVFCSMFHPISRVGNYSYPERWSVMSDSTVGQSYGSWGRVHLIKLTLTVLEYWRLQATTPIHDSVILAQSGKSLHNFPEPALVRSHCNPVTIPSTRYPIAVSCPILPKPNSSHELTVAK